MILPSSEQVTPQVTPQVLSLLKVLEGKQSRTELQELLNLKDREYFRKNYLKPAIEMGLVGLIIPDKPRSSKQKYYLTVKGQAVKDNLRENNSNKL